MMMLRPICFWLLIETAFFAATLACANTGKRMAARIAIMAITTSSSIRVNAFFMIIPEYLALGYIQKRFQKD
jgi:hypothetical protein